MSNFLSKAKHVTRNWMIAAFFIALSGAVGWSFAGNIRGLVTEAVVYTAVLLLFPTREMIFHPQRRYFKE